MEVKHTPGPWTVRHEPVWPWDIQISPYILTMKRAAYSTRAKTIEDMRQAVGFLGSERDEAIKAIAVQEADANLNAAAPDLLEALKDAVACGMVPISSALDGGANKHSEQVRVADKIRAALAKAEGRS